MITQIEDLTKIDSFSDKDLDTVVIQKPVISLESKDAPVNFLVVVDPDATNILDKYALPNVTVELRPLDKNKWHGKKGADDFDKGSVVEAEVHRGKFYTGLTRDEKVFLEELTGHKLNDTFVPTKPHEFYQQAVGRLRLSNETLFLDLANPLNYIKYKYAINHFAIYSSLDASMNEDKPFATHYIYKEEDENANEVNKAALIKQADTLFNTFNAKQLKNLYNVIFETDSRLLDDASIEAKVMLYKTANINKFIDKAKLNKDVLANMSLFYIGVARNIIQYTGGFYIFETINLGINANDGALVLAKPENQELRTRLINKTREA